MKLSLVPLFIVSVLIVHSQVSLVRSGMPGVFEPSSILSTPDGGYMNLKKEDAKMAGKTWNSFREIVTIIKYDRTFKRVNEVKLSGGSNIFSGWYGELKRIGQRYWFIYLEGQDAGSEEMGDIKAIEINPETLSTSEPKIVAKKSVMNDGLKKMPPSLIHFQTRVSYTGKYICLYLRQNTKDFYIACLDEGLSLRWEKKDELEMGDGYNEMRGFCSLEVSDDGRVYTGHRVKGGIVYSIYSPTGNLVRKPVNLGDVEAKEILFAAAANGNVYAYGTYKDGDNCKGVYKATIEKSGELTVIAKNEFPSSVVEPLKKEGWASTKERKYGVYPAFNAFLSRNAEDGICLTAELYAHPQYFHAGSILYTCFHNTTVSFGRAPKYWTGYAFPVYVYDGEHDQGSFYYSVSYGPNFILFYFDNPSNLKRDLALDADVDYPL